MGRERGVGNWVPYVVALAGTEIETCGKRTRIERARERGREGFPSHPAGIHYRQIPPARLSALLLSFSLLSSPFFSQRIPIPGCIISRAIIQSEFDNHSAQQLAGRPACRASGQGDREGVQRVVALSFDSPPRRILVIRSLISMFSHSRRRRRTDRRTDRCFRPPNNENATTLPRTITVTTAAPGPGFGYRVCHISCPRPESHSVYRNTEFNGISTGEMLDWFRPNSNVVPNNAVN